MTKPLTALQENAAKLFVEGNTQSDAYRKAGFKTDKCTDKTINEAASRLFRDSKVSARVKELQEIAQQRHNVTLDSLTQEYNEAKARCIAADNQASEISAINGKAKIHGFDRLVVDADIKTTVKIVDLSGKA